MIQRLAFYIIILFGSISVNIEAQETIDYELLSSVFDMEEEHHDHAHFFKGSTNEVQKTFSGLFWVYKNFISSQDGASCVFHPSCSQYTMESINQKGLFKGSLAAFDRLCRCNAFSPELYTIYEETRLFYDPVK